MNDGSAPLFERLEVLHDDWARSAAVNMALDETLLQNLADLPLLRIYRWERAAVSFGYFTPWRPVFDRYPAHDRVRRWTGGGVVEHGDDVTFSLLLPRAHPLRNGRAGQSYRVIHGALQSALARLGWTQTSLAAAADPDPRQVALDACFAHPVRDDLLSDGQKVSGGAQRRTRAGLLHQGSVRVVGPNLLDATALTEVLPSAFARNWELRPIRAAEERDSHRLAAVKYATDAWLHRV